MKLNLLKLRQSISFFGVKEEDIDPIYNDLGMEPGGHIGKSVRASKFCTGNTS